MSTIDPAAVLETIAVALGVLGAFLNAIRRVEGFYVWIVSNAIFIGLGFWWGHSATAGLFVVYTATSIIGIRNWKKKEKL